MELKPIAHNGQRQPLTTALRNVCRDYPAGGTVLREILQNADDAGATEVKFVLDESSYRVDQLIDPCLGQYQGPALLIYNNAVFTDTDFESLRLLGDSLKINDGSTTGKFGRGFSSVYNWTDSPSIVSREKLLIFDPHFEWTSQGGPIYDFVENHGVAAMKNHMEAYQTVMGHPDQYFDGTIIRIPLRTEAQAKESRISDLSTPVSEMLEILQTFASEFGKNGLLFMRNVDKITIASRSTWTTIEMLNQPAIRTHRLRVKNAVKSALEDPNYSFEHSFEATIQYHSTGPTKASTFMLHHNIHGPAVKDAALKEWAKRQKFIPWVAVAAELPIQSNDMTSRCLFTVLPLPVTTIQPVHVHGLFNLSSDRTRFHQANNRSTQDTYPVKWNDWILQEAVPEAWTSLLQYMAKCYPEQSAFEKWPRKLVDSRDVLSGSLEKIMQIIDDKSLALWPTKGGFMTAKDSLLSKGNESKELRDALQNIHAPIVYVPDYLQARTEEIFNSRVLCPESLCCFLESKNENARSWNQLDKRVILEFVISDPKFINYDSLELFPFKDGVYRSIGNWTSFLLRDDIENDLFAFDNSHNLDLDKISELTHAALKSGCDSSTIHRSICLRSAKSLRDYCKATIFQKIVMNQDSVMLDKKFAALVLKIWAWIVARKIDILDKDISCLWIIPLTNGHYRKVTPRSHLAMAYFAPDSEIGDLMRKLNTQWPDRPLPLLNVGPTGLTAGVVQLILNHQQVSKLGIEDGSRITVFLQWLHRNSSDLTGFTSEQKLQVAHLVAKYLPGSLSPSEGRDDIIKQLMPLKIFQRVSWDVNTHNVSIPVLTWTSLDYCQASIGLLDGLGPIPYIKSIQFLSAEHSSSYKRLLETLLLSRCLSSVQVIQEYIVPAWEARQDVTWTTACKEQVAASILGKFSMLTLDFQSRLQNIPIVPVSTLSGEATGKFAIASELIDPAVPELRELTFPNEDIVPKGRFLRDFSVALKGCGLRTTIDEAVVQHRLRCYVQLRHPASKVQDCVTKLLKSTPRWTTSLNELNDSSEIRRLKWLPAVDLQGNLLFKAANECRGYRDQLLVNCQLPILKTFVPSDWEARLGWNETLPASVLLSQLKYGIKNKDKKVVDAVLSYILENSLSESMGKELKTIPCVLSNNRSFVLPVRAFSPAKAGTSGCERLHPYLINVEHQFWKDHEYLLTTLGVRAKPSLSDLLGVQNILKEKPLLDEADKAVAIEMLSLASQIPDQPLSDLRVLDASGTLCPIHDIYFHDLGPLKSTLQLNVVHPDVPLSIVKRLGIESLRERLVKGMLEIEDVDDEDEFYQRESVTTRIADTLERYPIESTFREYLANADDAEGATKVSWLLDERTHRAVDLITPEMKMFHGPAFLVHNDGIFTDDDFDGFKNVGEGSKSQAKETIGQFGRGSQTMYHWADVPQILSGKYLLILDPQQEVLPKNHIKGKRKPGVKLRLSKLRHTFADQLIPFVGLWGYEQDLDEYPGTIFRFPLRTTPEKSPWSFVNPSGRATSTNLNTRLRKREVNSNEICQLMEDYFNEARISLLFLRRVKSIDFSIHGDPGSGWSISRRPPLDEDAKSFSELVMCSYTKATTANVKVSGIDRWWVAIEDLLLEADRLPNTARRVMKNVECGIAALISTPSASPGTLVPKVIQSRMFSTLPLPISSDLPVHIHATFSLSGDRQSIAIDEEGPKSYHSKWNRFLLEDALPKLYLSFLDDIGPQARQRVFNFWPQKSPPKGGHSEVLCDSFWKILPQSSRRLFPKAEVRVVLPQRRPAELFDLTQAVFDFLPKNQSDVLAPFLTALGIKLVRNIPVYVSKQLKTLPRVAIVVAPLLRGLMKTGMAKAYLQKEMEKNSHLLDVLIANIISVDAEVADLDGCHILPIADGSLGTLKLANDTEVETYYVATDEELKLFSFASSYLVNIQTATKLEPVIVGKKFNILPLHLDAVKRLLGLRPLVTTPNSDADKWLSEFWEYWNDHNDSTLLAIDDIQVPIFRASLNNISRYATPAQFHGLPAVIEPNHESQQQLCRKVPGLLCLDPKFMPKALGAKSSFNHEDSFYKLLRALKALSGRSGWSTFLASHLDNIDMEIIQNLVLQHVGCKALSKESENFRALRTDLQLIPVWPRFRAVSGGKLLSASEALRATEPQLMVPWMKEGALFINHAHFQNSSKLKQCLVNLGVKEISNDSLLKDYILPLPLTLSADHRKHYHALLQVISTRSSQMDHATLSVLKSSNFAVDGNGTLRKSNKLYDHQSIIFLSAFRHQVKARFLDETFQNYRSFFLEIGLCEGTYNLTARDYQCCLEVMAQRLAANDSSADDELQEDSTVVLTPLTNSHSRHFSFGCGPSAEEDLLTISRERVFQSREIAVNEIGYRRTYMATVATRQKLLCLSEIIDPTYIPVCWSQTPFALHQPSSGIMAHVTGSGQPTCITVWQHLQHMKGMAQDLRQEEMQDFLFDLRQTYTYLQDHLDKCKSAFKLKDGAIWLNLPTWNHNVVHLNDLKSSWHSIDDLVLSSSCDAGPIKAVKPGLMYYESLLRHLRCKSIVYPTITRPKIHDGRSVSKSLRRLRKEGKLLDITYSTEGRCIQAHRVVLAAISEKCARQFGGNWSVENLIEFNKNDGPDDFISYHTLSTMIDYAYEDNINWADMEVSNDDIEETKATKLDLLLDLTKGADYWMIDTLKSEVEDKIVAAGRMFINLKNVEEVRERAVLAGANSVEEMCDKFIAENQAVVEKAHRAKP